jgi:hypothetical protein
MQEYDFPRAFAYPTKIASFDQYRILRNTNMFVSAVSSISLAVFTNLSIMELDNAKLAQSRNEVPEIINEAPVIQASVPTSDAPAQASEDSIQAIESAQDSATASVWAKDEVKRHRGRN